MLPLGVIAVFMSSVVLRFKCDTGYYGNAEEGAEPELVLHRPPVAYLMLGNGILVAGAIVFYVDNRLHGTWIVCILPAVGTVIASAIWCRLWRQQRSRGEPHMQPTPLRASLLTTDDDNSEVASPHSQRDTVDDPDNRDRAQSAIALSNIAEAYNINVKQSPPRRHTTAAAYEGSHVGSGRAAPDGSEDFPYHRMTR